MHNALRALFTSKTQLIRLQYGLYSISSNYRLAPANCVRMYPLESRDNCLRGADFLRNSHSADQKYPTLYAACYAQTLYAVHSDVFRHLGIESNATKNVWLISGWSTVSANDTLTSG